MLKKSLFVFLFSAVLLGCTTVGITQEKKGLDFAKQLVKDTITGDYKDVAIKAVLKVFLSEYYDRIRSGDLPLADAADVYPGPEQIPQWHALSRTRR